MVDFTREESWGVLYVFGIPVIDGLYAETVEQRTTWENRIPSLVRWASSVRWTPTWTTAEEYRDATGARHYKPKNALPGAQPAPSVPDLLESLRCACNYIDKLGGVSQQYRAMLASPEAKP